MKILFTLFLFICSLPVFSQITITEADMPQPGNMIRYSLTVNFQTDFTRTGSDTTWDFSSAAPMTQRVDTFLTVQQTPLFYWLVFTPGTVANLAVRNNAMPTIPVGGMGLISNNFTFFKNSATAFSDVGLALQISGLPFMVKYDNPDQYYSLPCTMGDTWSSVSFSSATIPGMGFYKTKRTRSSVVDGYGTVITPLGTFPVIRVKSNLLEEDSIYIDSLNMGIPLNQQSTEYKWLAMGKGTPVFQAVQSGLVTTVTYQDVDRHLGIPETSRVTATAWPDPSTGRFRISLPIRDERMDLEVFSADGRRIFYKNLKMMNGTSEEISVTGTEGLLFLKLTGKSHIYTGKVLVNNF